MGGAASVSAPPYATAEDALEDGKTQEEVDAYLRSHTVTKEELAALTPKDFAAFLRNPANASRLANSIEAAGVSGSAVADLLFMLPLHIDVPIPAELQAFEAPSDVDGIAKAKAAVRALEGGGDTKDLRGAVDVLAKELLAYRDGATKTYDQIHKLPGIVRAGSKTFSDLYGAASKVVQQQDDFGTFGQLMEEVARLLPKTKPLQTMRDPITLRERGLVVLKQHYAPFVKQLGAHLQSKDLACEAEAAPPKHVYRIVEKSIFREDDDAGNADFVKDIVRGKAQSAEMRVLNAALEFLLSEHEKGVVRIVWAKDRFSKPSAGGWSDGMVNLVFTADETQHICELQLIHSAMMLQRQSMGGHGAYNRYRAAQELMDYSSATKDLAGMARSQIDGELGALRSLYESWGRPEALADWATEEPLAEWDNVELDELGHVMAIDVYDEGLAGPLGSALSELRYLQTLEVSSNKLTGTLEPLQACVALQTLDLSVNQLTGTLEPLQACVALQTLKLSVNQLTGTLEPLQACVALQTLDLTSNKLTGTLEPLQACVALQTLNLSRNKLTGTLEPLQACVALQTLQLGNNLLTGTLEPLQACVALQTLVLYSNQLTGTLEPLQACVALQTLDLNDNQLTGTLEPLQACVALQKLVLYSNQLTLTDEQREHFEARVNDCNI